MEKTPPKPIYGPLEQARSIRLVKFELATPQGAISCSLSEYPLDDAPRFLALSYVWGDLSKTSAIECDGGTMAIGENLGAAIRQLCSRYPGSSFWIDAICIDQSNLQERARQVQLMRDIYKSAENVVVYLGEDEEGLPRAMSLFDTLDSAAVSHELAKQRGQATGDPSFLRSRLPDPCEEVWYRLHDFFDRPWFSRIWTLQEIVLASANPVVICGSYALPWDRVLRVAEFMHTTGVVGATVRRSKTLHVVRAQQFKLYPPPLQQMLQQTLQYRSTDPRDRLFALYGIVSDEERKAVLDSKYFAVSYEKSVKDVYRDAVLGYIRHYGTLELMCSLGGGGDSRVKDLPSWVPDFSAPMLLRHPSLSAVVGLAGYNACAGRGVLVADSGNPDVLRVAGQSHDTVEWVSDPLREEDYQPLPYKRRPYVLERIWDAVMGRLGKDESTCEAFWRTLIRNSGLDGKPASRKTYLAFLRYWADTKQHDAWASEHQATGRSEVASRHESEDMAMFQQASEKINRSISAEEFDALKAWTELQAQKFLPCTGTPSCTHCAISGMLEKRLADGLLTVTGPSVALEFKETDPFIQAYFDNLATNTMILQVDQNTEYLGPLRSTLLNRVFFVTRGGLLGLGPRRTRPGAEVAVLSGSRIPFILENTGTSSTQLDLDISQPRVIQQCRVLGDCYVHGIMSGEAVNNLDWDSGHYQVFDLV